MTERKKPKRRIARSIFWKLFFMLISAAMLIILLVVIFFRAMFSQTSQDITRQNAETYARYIVQDIGDPPDTLHAKQIALENNLIIYYESQELVWSSKEDPALLKDHWLQRRKGKAGWYKMYYLIQVPTANGEFLLGLDYKSNPQNHGWQVALLALLIALIVAGLYISIRYILQPIQWLNQGVSKVATGNFDQQVAVRKMDQLGQLTTSFNNMTRKIKEMINARNQLLLDVSHEMRSPLTRVKVALELMPESDTKKSINEDIDDLEWMLSEILETERIDSPHQKLNLEKTNLVELINEIAPKYKDSKPGLNFKGLKASCYVKGDAERLKICLRNIIENGLKFSNEQAKPLEIYIETQSDTHTISIQDFGQGIPAADLPYIFEPFYRVDKSRSKNTGGYGLGMSLCKKIIEAHDGQIEINSVENEGTVVMIIFPVLQRGDVSKL